VRARRIDLYGQGVQDAVERRRPGQGDDRGEGHPIGGEHARQPAQVVAAEGQPLLRRGQEAAVQQIAREREEERNPEVAATEQPAPQAAGGDTAGQVGRVRRHDERNGHGA